MHLATRTFWCLSCEREVEVMFAETGVPGFRHPIEVRDCSAFESGDEICCRRMCVDPSYRRPSAPPDLLAGL